MSAASKKGYSREEELLLHDFSRNVSTKSSALFYGNALIVSATSIWLFWRIHQMNIYSSAFVFVIVTALTTWLIAYSYKHVKYILKFKIASKRGEAVTREVNKLISDDKKMTKKERDERVLWKQNEVADFEATTFAIFYNNALFLALVIVSSFYLLSSFSPTINYVFSVTLSGGLCALLSTSTK
ncbi:translocon-associated protein subunit gamma [Tetranychus urticae]|uniref:Translocon-associated protein subunit gamma n=1 Tax=Tetranychus urticae TaxID=32264 RepID=T1JUW7_TETUR|nr:translocon-associated protein subunit gamma [Tetranychus urticae]